jgi:hypothetical protein
MAMTLPAFLRQSQALCSPECHPLVAEPPLIKFQKHDLLQSQSGKSARRNIISVKAAVPNQQQAIIE